MRPMPEVNNKHKLTIQAVIRAFFMIYSFPCATCLRIVLIEFPKNQKVKTELQKRTIYFL